MLADFERNMVMLRDDYKEVEPNVFVGKDVSRARLVEFNTDNGPVLIDDGAVINPFTAIWGPAYIGKNSVLDRAYIHSATVIGNTCKISGEVEECYFMDYSNKHHTGFFGHSYVGEWVNIGALSTTSDLKNNYSPIKFEMHDKVIDSGTIKMGSLFGDHVKLAIGLMINCGTIIGEGSVLFASPSAKTIAPVRWGDKEYIKTKFEETCEKIMKRRSVELPDTYKKLMDELYQGIK